MNPTQALVAIWLNVASENTEEFRKWHNCEHSTDRMDGPGFRVGYRYNAVDENAHHNILCTFEGDTLEAFTSDYYRESRDNPSPWTRQCMAFINNAERAVYSLQATIGEPHRYDASREPAPVLVGQPFGRVLRSLLIAVECRCCEG